MPSGLVDVPTALDQGFEVSDFDEGRQRIETEVANALFLAIPVEWDDARLQVELAPERTNPDPRISIDRIPLVGSGSRFAIEPTDDIRAAVAKLVTMLMSEVPASATIVCEVSRRTGEEWSFKFRYQSAK